MVVGGGGGGGGGSGSGGGGEWQLWVVLVVEHRRQTSVCSATYATDRIV